MKGSIDALNSFKDDDTMQAQTFKEILIRILMVEHIGMIKTDDSQKSITLEGLEGDKIITYLESHDLNLSYCRMCECIVPDSQTADQHLSSKQHKKTREELWIKDWESLQYSILTFHSTPGDIEKELHREKEKALKRKVQRIKTEMVHM